MTYSSSLEGFLRASQPTQALGAGEAFGQEGGPSANASANSATDSARYSVGGNPMGGPVAAIFAFLVFFVIVRYVLEAGHPEHESVFGEIKMSIWNVVTVTVFAIPGIALVKGLVLPHLDSKNPVAQVIAAA